MEQKYSDALYIFKNSPKTVRGEFTIHDEEPQYIFCQEALDRQERGEELWGVVIERDIPVEIVNESPAGAAFVLCKKMGPSTISLS